MDNYKSKESLSRVVVMVAEMLYLDRQNSKHLQVLHQVKYNK